VRIELGHRVRAAGIKRRCFALRDFLHQTIEFAGGCLVKAGGFFASEDSDGFQQA
jgi:hypothetical protein